MPSAIRQALPGPYAARLTAIAAGVAGLLFTTTARATPATLVLLALAVAAGLVPVARAAATAPGAPRVRVHPDAPGGGRPVRLGLRRRPAPAATGWGPSTWDPGDVAPWSPDSDGRV